MSLRAFAVCATVAVFGLLLFAESGFAYHDLIRDGLWMHQHTRTLPTCVQGGDASERHATQRARRGWNRRTILKLPRDSDCGRARFIVRFGWYGFTGWDGRATVCYHCNKTVARMNLSTLRFRPRWYVRAIACHEIGHLLGLGHGGGGCMVKIPTQWYPSRHDVHFVNHLYTQPH